MRFEKQFNIELAGILGGISEECPKTTIIEKIVALIRKFKGDERFLENAAEILLKRAMRASDNNEQGDFFPDDAIISLGNNQIVRRGSITTKDQLYRRLSIITNNRDNVVSRCAKEIAWIHNKIDSLAAE